MSGLRHCEIAQYGSRRVRAEARARRGRDERADWPRLSSKARPDWPGSVAQWRDGFFWEKEGEREGWAVGDRREIKGEGGLWESAPSAGGNPRRERGGGGRARTRVGKSPRTGVWPRDARPSPHAARVGEGMSARCKGGMYFPSLPFPVQCGRAWIGSESPVKWGGVED